MYREIKTGTGTTLDRPTSENKYRWARSGKWRVAYWPNGGGCQGYVNVEGIGWVVDVLDEMPHETWLALLEAVGAPTITDRPMPEFRGDC